MEIKNDTITTKGTRILFGGKAVRKYNAIKDAESYLWQRDFRPIYLPNLQFQSTFAGKVGDENNHMMYNFKDQGGRDLCLAPEYTAVIQKLANTTFKHQKDVKLFYVQECFRAEKPQAGRYRQFTQLGVEIINPTNDYIHELGELALRLIWPTVLRGETVRGLPAKVDPHDWLEDNIILHKGVTRGLDYYEQGSGFEITCDTLGAQKQICGGGSYEGGVGFAIGVDRLLLI